jgi:hypothetical protein
MEDKKQSKREQPATKPRIKEQRHKQTKRLFGHNSSFFWQNNLVVNKKPYGNMHLQAVDSASLLANNNLWHPK